jgi:uncharacterized protein (TIGR03435 family)
MRRSLAIVSGVIISGLVSTPHVWAQTQPTAAPAFEVASIKANHSGDRRMMMSTAPGGRVNVTNLTVKQLITMAYRIKDSQLSGGPGWIDSERYDISAKAEGPATPEQLQVMMQTLLADRFKLSLRRETKEMPVYALVIAKDGPKLHENKEAEIEKQQAKPDGAKPGDPNAPPPKGQFMRMGRGLLSSQGAPLTVLADSLSRLLGRVVLDKTELTGLYDFELKWTPDESQGQMFKGPDGADSAPPPDASGPTIFTALQEQLGLKLESQKGPVEVFVIDHVEKPTEN